MQRIKDTILRPIRYFMLSPHLLWARTILFLILGCAIVISVTYFANSESRVAESEDPEHVVDAELDSYERVLNEGNPDEIIGFIGLIKIEKNEPLPIHIEKINQAITLSDRLLRIGTNDEHARTGQTVKLNSYCRLLDLHQKIEEDPSTTMSTIRDLSASLENHEDPIVKRTAKLSNLYVEFAEYRRNGRDEQSLNDQIIELIKTDPDDAQLVNNIVVLLNKYSNLGVDVAKFLKIVQAESSKSDDPEVKSMVASIESVFFNLNYKIVPLTETEKSNLKDAFVNEMTKARKMIFKMSTEEFVKEGVLASLFQSTAVLLQAAEHDQTREIFKKAGEAFEIHKDNTTIYPRFKALERIVNLLGKDLPVDHLVKADGTKLSLSGDRTSPDLLVFMLPSAVNPTKKIVEELANGFDTLLMDKLLKLTVVFVGEGESDDAAWNEIKTTLDSFENVQDVRININDNKEFFEQITLPWSPCWVVVSKDGKLGEFNPLPPLLRSRMVNYVDNRQPSDNAN